LILKCATVRLRLIIISRIFVEVKEMVPLYPKVTVKSKPPILQTILEEHKDSKRIGFQTRYIFKD